MNVATTKLVFTLQPNEFSETIIRVEQSIGDADTVVTIVVDGDAIVEFDWERELLTEEIAVQLAERFVDCAGDRTSLGDVVSLAGDELRVICEVVDYYDAIAKFTMPINGVNLLDVDFVIATLAEAVPVEEDDVVETLLNKIEAKRNAIAPTL